MKHLRTSSRFLRQRSRGSIYAMVLGITLLITVIGIGALTTARVTSRAAGVANDWLETGAISFSAVEHAITKLNSEGTASSSTWRNAYTSGAVAFDAEFGRGRLKWVLVDEADGIFNDDYGDEIKVYGIGQIGTTKRVYSVKLSPGGEGLEVLRTACHSNGNLRISDTTIAVGGPVSTNGSLDLNGTLRGSSEVAGSGGTSSAAKPMPNASVFDLYFAMGTILPSSAASSGTFSPGVLTAGDNPYGAENAQGIYILQIPETVSSVEIQPCRIKGTLLIEGSANRSDHDLVIRGAMLIEPHAPTLPTIITRRIRRVTIEGSIAPYTESLGLVSYPSEIRGLLHFIGTSNVYLRNATHIRGTVVADGAMELDGTVGLTADPSLLANPPKGYSKGNLITPVAGSWKWDAPPPGVN